MGQITYNYPGMLGTAAEMNGQAAALTAMGGNVEAEQAALGGSWVGDTGTTVQQWMTQWNSALQETTEGLRGMASAHENNTLQMMGRDNAQGAKWG
ncbi:WXG100 family type VII secretion target [Mycobacterium avium subsp. hominissuis]|uniref:WXG100 family type VII secretion target n=1 Tax=Mycobacterium TaxID=1763 RepID=UPI0002A55B0F|nr:MULTISPECIES: WXG100 family type VII secretion target [Mycobacterium]AGB27321.1 WXG100 family type VII secretion target [Mycobacterium sp. JS623]MDO2394813.1 WXG100 family type VII secretion target [Mycobacterium avium subsp. hominissuis]